MREIFEKIIKNEDTRKNLIELKSILKDEKNRKSFLFNFADKKDVFIELLNSEDAKIRKNTAVIMGELRDKAFLKPLMNAYRAEKTLFVRSEYLNALGQFNYSEYVDELRERLEELRRTEVTDSDRKHVDEEIRSLNSLVSMYEGSKKHIFTGINKKPAMILLTNRNYSDITADKISGAKTFNAGVMVDEGSITIKEVLDIRTYSELLFIINKMKTVDTDIKSAAEKIVKSDIFKFLKELYDTSDTFNFRIELKDKMDLQKKSKFTKKLASEIERMSNYRLVNNPSDYEIEIRLIRNKEDRYNCLVKLYSIDDKRFEYRQNVVAESIKPEIAALIMEIAKDYLKDNARVLDPFCGVGTMLIERYMYKKTDTLYGVDKSAEAVEMARLNTEYAHKIVHYINRNCADFRHEYKFDEIITNMPMELNNNVDKNVEEAYKILAGKAHEWFNDEGIIVLYSHNPEYVNRYFTKEYKIVLKAEINKKQDAYVFVIKNA